MKNYTEYIILEKLSELLKDMLSMTQISCNFYYIPNNLKKGNMLYKGISEKVDYADNIFKVFLKEGLSKSNLLLILCHEFIHIKQYLDGRLRLDGTKAIWEDKEYDMLDIDYMDRPWETEAFRMQGKLYKKVKRKMKDEGT